MDGSLRVVGILRRLAQDSTSSSSNRQGAEASSLLKPGPGITHHTSSIAFYWSSGYRAYIDSGGGKIDSILPWGRVKHRGGKKLMMIILEVSYYNVLRVIILLLIIITVSSLE